MTTSIVTIQDICELGNGDNSFEVELFRPLSLNELRESEIGEELMHWQDWYTGRPWAQAQVPAGKYAVRLPILGSSNKTSAEQRELLLPGEEPMPVALGALALLCLHKAGYLDPLLNGWIRCAEEVAPNRPIVLHRGYRYLVVSGRWGDNRFVSVEAGGVRTS